jgi:hypothetical protein
MASPGVLYPMKYVPQIDYASGVRMMLKTISWVMKMPRSEKD